MIEKPTILVVDDDPLMLSIAARVLQEEGYQVETAGTGEEALRLAQEVEPDLLLLDVILPDVNGVEVSRRIKGVEDGRAFLSLSTRRGRRSPAGAGAGDR